VRQRLENLLEKTEEFVAIHDRQQDFETHTAKRMLQWLGNQFDLWTVYNTIVIHVVLMLSDLQLQPQTEGSMSVLDDLEQRATIWNNGHHGRRALLESVNSTEEPDATLTIDFQQMDWIDYLALLHVFTSTLKVLVFILEGPWDQYCNGKEEMLQKINEKTEARAKRELRIRPKRGKLIPLEVTKTPKTKSSCARVLTSCCRSKETGEDRTLIEQHIRSVAGDQYVESVSTQVICRCL